MVERHRYTEVGHPLGERGTFQPAAHFAGDAGRLRHPMPPACESA
jgi:hypothetical protein